MDIKNDVCREIGAIFTVFDGRFFQGDREISLESGSKLQAVRGEIVVLYKDRAVVPTRRRECTLRRAFDEEPLFVCLTPDGTPIQNVWSVSLGELVNGQEFTLQSVPQKGVVHLPCSSAEMRACQ